MRGERKTGKNHYPVHPSTQPELKREYTLYEIAIITRAGPAKALGLETKGHLGVGADADITIYDSMDDKEMMFSTARYVFKSGEPMIANHEFKTDSHGTVYHIEPTYDNKIQEGNCKNGKKHGKWISYLEDGQIWYEENYIDGKEVGKWIQYNGDGTIKKVKEY